MKNKIAIIIILAVALVTGSFYLFDGEKKSETPEPENLPAKNEIKVYVSGQVKTPSVVTLEDNGNLRSVDAINAAGGLTEFADTEVINLAEHLTDGQHIHIPTKEIALQETPPAQTETSDKKPESGKKSGDVVNINTADENELQKIRGVGPAIAKRIVDYREQNGKFQTIEDIKKVRGIGDKTFEKMKDKITI